ncbi:MAG: DegT/DnrJ/EryC1/StrS family aminotransferase [bacterium]|nr:DegT/DnrJ/EryC1/StrS family aminotransferase [bacterium]
MGKIKKDASMIPVLRPTADEQTKKELIEVIDSGWWGEGPKVAELEEKFAEKVGAKYAMATNSCTAALDMALKLYSISDGELITTPMTFVADAIVGEWNGMDVSFCDVDRRTLCLDPTALKINNNTRAIIAVHSHGRLCDIDGIRKRFGGVIIEDCAHAMHTPGAGTKGDIAVWSFQAVKTLPAGDGGMITTNSHELYQMAKNMRWLGVGKSTFDRTGDKKYSWDYDITGNGLKYYMTDLNAVLALGGLRRIDSLTARRREIQAKYNEAFAELAGVIVPEHSHTVQYYTLETVNRDTVSTRLAERKIATSVHFKPLSEMTYWKKAVKYPLPVTSSVWPNLLSLPCHDALKDDDVEYIIGTFEEIVNELTYN